MDLTEFDIDFLSQKLSDNPQSPLFARLADLYLSRNQAAEAVKLCEAGVGNFPSYVSGYIILGRSYLATKEFAKARLAFQEAVNLSPFNQMAQKLLSELPPIPSPEGVPSVEPEVVEKTLEGIPAAEQEVTQEVLAAEVTEAPVQEITQEPVQEITQEPVQVVAQEYPERENPVAVFPTLEEFLEQEMKDVQRGITMSLDEYLGTGNYKTEPVNLDAITEQLEGASALESTVITPTLAEIYASQGEYSAAIQAYEILMLSKPEERERFEKRIKELQAKLFESGG